MKYNKLVRDRIPEIITESGKKVTFRILDDDEEYKIALEKKLDEEVAEFHESKSLEEIVDILEVLDALILAHSFNRVSAVLKKKEKREERGGFGKKIFLLEVEDD